MACGQTVLVNALVLVLGANLAPAEARTARSSVSDSPFGNLFRDFGPPRRAVRPTTLAIVPLPKPRPAEAPVPPPQRVERTEPKSGPVPFPAPLPVPVPEARPPQADPAPASAAAPSAAPPGTAPSGPAPVPQATPRVAEPAVPPPPSACRLALTDQIAVAPSIPDITGPGSCGGTDLVRLEAVVVPGKGTVPLKPAATLRCEMATVVAGWIRDDMVPLAASLGTSIGELDNFDSFDCRGRNRVKGAKMSEHGRANALDVRGLKFANGQSVSLTDSAAPRETREKVLQSVCARFTTVLGPGSDGYHEDHIHLDIAARRSGYRICQWMIYEPMPQIAPLMPAARPPDAPPRVVADDKSQTQRPAAPAAATAPAATAPANAEEEEAEPAPPPAKPARKGRTRR